MSIVSVLLGIASVIVIGVIVVCALAALDGGGL